RIRERLHAPGLPNRQGRSLGLVRSRADREGQEPHEDAVVGRGAGQVRTLGPSVFEPMLDGLRVVEIVDADQWAAAAVAQCGRILADLGADVVKAEPPEGDPVRRVPPFVGDEADPDRGLMWIALNANKRSVDVSRKDEKAHAELLRDADVDEQTSLLVRPTLRGLASLLRQRHERE